MTSRFRSSLGHVRRHPFIAGATLIVLILALVWARHDDDSGKALPLIVRVTTGDIENTVTAEGSLKPSKYVDVGAQVSGQLKKLYVNIGDVVKKGQLLAVIDASVQAQKVAASKASLQSLQAQLVAKRAALTLARANLQRQTNLLRDNANTPQDYDDAVDSLALAKSALAELQAQIVQAKASLASDEAQLGYSKIYAPMAGTVIAVDMTEGQTLNAVQQAPTILRIADLSTMTVETSVSEADVAKLHDGMPVYFTTLGGGIRRWYGKLRQIWPTPQIVNNVVLYTALFDVANKDGTLLPDMTAQVFFITAQARDVTTVPVGALSFGDLQAQGAPGIAAGIPQAAAGRSHATPGKLHRVQRHRRQTPNQWRHAGGRGRLATVRLVKNNGDIIRRRVRIGVMNRVDAQVLSGLEPGDRVVAGILQRLHQPSREERRPRFRRFL